MKIVRRVGLLVCKLIIAMTLAGCGGGSSSGGAGGGSFTGTYSGTFTLTVSAPGSGVAPVTVPGTTTVVINPNGTVVVDPGPEQFTGTITGNKFTASFPASDLNEPGFTCSGTITLVGTGTGNTFTGTVGGPVTCNGISMMVTGSFNVSRIAKALLKDTPLVNEFRRAVHQVLAQ